jgi:hypothetical protein
MTKSQKNQIALSLASIATTLLLMKGSWEETLWFLFRLPGMEPRSLPDVDPHQVWVASHGTWLFFTLVFFSGQLFWRLLSVLADSKKAEQATDGIEETQVGTRRSHAERVN